MTQNTGLGEATSKSSSIRRHRLQSRNEEEGQRQQAGSRPGDFKPEGASIRLVRHANSALVAWDKSASLCAHILCTTADQRATALLCDRPQTTGQEPATDSRCLQAKRFKEGLKALKDMKGGKVKVKKKKKSDGVAAPADGTESLDSAMTSAVAEEGQEGAAGQAVEGALPHEDSIESLDDEGEEGEDGEEEGQDDDVHGGEEDREDDDDAADAGEQKVD